MDILRALLKMKQPGERKPDFERFRRSCTSNEPGPVTVGDIFADFETVGNFLKEPVLDYLRLAEESMAEQVKRVVKKLRGEGTTLYKR